MTAQFPPPHTDDPEEIADALETGATLWANGNSDEALRWLARATESAQQGGRQDRASDLTRATAELKAQLVGAIPGPSARPPPRPPPLPGASQPPAATTPLHATRPPPPPRSMHPVGNGSESPASAPRPGTGATSPQPDAPGAQGNGQPAERNTRVSDSIDLSSARRMAVKQSARDDALWVARSLDDGETPPAGSRAALVVFLDET